MKFRPGQYVLVILFTLGILTYPSCAPTELDADLAIIHVNVIPMDDERVLESQTVLIRDGIIYRTGPSDRIHVADDVPVIEGDGRYLIPGLAEMHAHVPSPPEEFPDEESRQNFEQWLEDVLFLYVAAGNTTARSMIGHPNHLQIREQLEAGEIIGPRLWTSGPGLHGGNLQTSRACPRSAVRTKRGRLRFHEVVMGSRA